MKDVKLNTKEAVSGKAAGQAAHEVLLDALSESPNYSMPISEAIELLYAGDERTSGKIMHSFASVKTYCWTKSDWRVGFTDQSRKEIGILGKRVAGTDTYNPIA